jgi:hypothetical protein
MQTRSKDVYYSLSWSLHVLEVYCWRVLVNMLVWSMFITHKLLESMTNNYLYSFNSLCWRKMIYPCILKLGQVQNLKMRLRNEVTIKITKTNTMLLTKKTMVKRVIGENLKKTLSDPTLVKIINLLFLYYFLCYII